MAEANRLKEMFDAHSHFSLLLGAKQLCYQLLVLPLVFSICFFAYFSPHFDAILYIDNIVGEGNCSSFLSSKDVSFAYLYQGNAYFGSELKTLRLSELRYNINEITLSVYDVESADIVAFDISIFGHIVTHLDSTGLTHSFTPDTVHDAVTTNGEPIIHIELEDPVEGGSVTLTGFDFIPVWVWIAYSALIIGVSLAVSVGLAKLIERFPKILPPILSAATIMATLLAGAFFCGSMPYVDYTDFMLNWFILFAVSLALGALTLPWLGTLITSGLTLIWYIANFFVISFRSKPIMPSDLRAISTAKEVVSGYSLVPTWQMIVGIVTVILYCAVTFFVYRNQSLKTDKRTYKETLKPRAVVLCTAIAMVVIGLNNPAFASLNSFQWDASVLESFHREGIILTFIKSAMSSHVVRPEGYSREVVDEFLADYQTQLVEDTQSTSADTDVIQPVNIIMVMDEAFSDLREVGLDPRIDVMPFIDSLDENTLEGSLYVSIFGGGTCNTEFEGLTGNSLAFMGTGAYPYTENITDPLFSLASYLSERGYATEAFHAANATNWNRNIVYPNLGFDTFNAINAYESFSEITYLHNLPADITDFRFIESESANLAGQSRFLFNVTIQNHSGYNHFEDVEEDATVAEYGADLSNDARVYLSLVRATDASVQQLVETYQNSDEPTMIIFFGDHQPGLSQSTIDQIYTGVYSNLDLFKTKFFIWTNYETETQHDVAISANYLPWLILERAHMPLPPYLQLLAEVHEKYPVISSQGVIDAEGNIYASVDELVDDPLIQRYRYVQYANLFDELDPAWFEVG